MDHQNKKQSDEFCKRLFFNKYRPVKKLGEGSFGKIYSAVNINTNQKFALKMVKNNYLFLLFIYRK